MNEAKHTPIPWQFSNRNWRNEEVEHDLYIVGNSISDGTCCTAVAIVKGNATSGDIPDANAEFICRAVNNHARLLAACKYFCEHYPTDPYWHIAAAAIAEAERTMTQ